MKCKIVLRREKKKLVTINTVCPFCKQAISFKRKYTYQDTPYRKCPKCREFIYKSKPSDFVIQL